MLRVARPLGSMLPMQRSLPRGPVITLQAKRFIKVDVTAHCNLTGAISKMDKIRVDRTLHDYYEEVNMYHCPKGRRKFLRSKLIPHKRYIRWTQEMEEYMDDIGKAPRKAPRNLSGIKLARSVE